MYKEKIAAALDFAYIDEDGCLVFQQNVNYSTWGDGCAIGRSSADQLIAYLRTDQDTVILARVVQAMVKPAVDPNAIMTGFFQRISEHLLSVR